MAYLYDTAIISIAPPQRGLVTIEPLSKPPILTPDGREFILSTQFLQWLHADQTTTTLYTSSLRAQECDIVIRNVAGHETPFILLPSGVPSPTPDDAGDPYLTLVSLAVMRTLAPPALLAAPQPTPAPHPVPVSSSLEMFPIVAAKMRGISYPSYDTTPAFSSTSIVPSPLHGPALHPPAANIQMRCKARGIPNRRPSRPSLVDLVCEWYDFIHGTQKGYNPDCPSITGSDVLKVKARRTVDAVMSFPWALVVAGVGFVLAVVF